MKFINLTPHDINMNNGDVFEKSGNVARVQEVFEETHNPILKSSRYGEVYDLPEKKEGVMYIVSSIVMDALPERKDLCSPITFGPDVVRNVKGHIVSVPALKCRG